jgi:alpha-D-xyloside xylohydrolase
MQHLIRICFEFLRGLQRHRRTSRATSCFRAPNFILLALTIAASTAAQQNSNQIVLKRDGRTIVLEPYGANIIRITLSTDEPTALGKAGYGIVGTPSMAGWTHTQDSEGYDVIGSGRLIVHIAPQDLPSPHAMPLDPLNQSLRDRYFPLDDRGHSTHNDEITITTSSGKPLLTMRRWAMVPNRSTELSQSLSSVQKGDLGSRISATFNSPQDEHYYGLGQQQQGFLDLRDHRINCWHDYGAIGGENVCVPFMISSRGYGLIWDNPSKTTIDLGFNQQKRLVVRGRRPRLLFCNRWREKR